MCKDTVFIHTLWDHLHQADILPWASKSAAGAFSKHTPRGMISNKCMYPVSTFKQSKVMEENIPLSRHLLVITESTTQ